MLTALMLAVLVFGTHPDERAGSAARRPGRCGSRWCRATSRRAIKWDPTFLDTSFNVYVDQTEQAARHHVDLVVWPEAAAAFFFQPTALYPPRFADDAVYRDRLLKLAADTGDPILFGAPALGVAADGRIGAYNRAYLVSGAGKVVGWYDKIQLVPFGEYVPMRPLLGFLVNRIVHGFGDMIRGDRADAVPGQGRAGSAC